MKRALSFLLSAALLLALLPACQQPAAETAAPSPWPAALDVVNAVFPSCGFDRVSADVEYLTIEDGDDFLGAYLENAYGLTAGTWEDAAVIRAAGASAFELAVLRLADDSAAVQAATALTTYMFSRQGDFAGYAPAEADMTAKGSVNQDGPYAALFICPDTASADAAFQAAVHGKAVPRPEQPVEGLTAAEVATLLDSLYEQRNDTPEGVLERLDGSDPEALSGYISSAYGLDGSQWEEAAIVHGLEASAFELAVLRVKDEDTAWDVMDLLSSYLLDREGRFAGYATDQAALLHQAVIRSVVAGSSGIFVLLLVCESPEQVFNELTAVLQPDSIGTVDRYSNDFISHVPETDPDYSNRVKFVPPNKEDMSLYDTSAIRAAWENDDPSGLSKEDRKIYDKAKAVLRTVLKDGMSDLEKETSIYSWVVNNVNYDWTHQDRMKETPRESFTPYGGLVNQKAVCLGYAATFQLLCDLAGVECITVVGAAFESREDHGWNMVRLDDVWYCLDVTWDANYRERGVSRGRERDWRWFNVTSSRMAETDHQWDYANTPEAVAEGNGRG